MIIRVCRHCGNLIELLHNSQVPLICCGEPMLELVPNTVEASGEKHIPVVTSQNGVITVHVGSVTHPMAPEHYIQWIALQTDQGTHRTFLSPGQEPSAAFTIGDEKPIAVYAYCNLHGLWKTQL